MNDETLRKLKTHCKNGHEFTEANTYRISTRPQWRICLTCKRESWKWAKRPPASKAKHLSYSTIEEIRARGALRNAVSRGAIKRQPCAICGDPKSEGHHPDYKKPLEVVWLCKKHHAAVHRRAA